MRTAPTMGKVKSNDGTLIAYDRYGQGPPVILVGGALTSAQRSFPAFVELATELTGAAEATAATARPTRSIGRSKTSRLSSTKPAERPRSTACPPAQFSPSKQPLAARPSPN
jgi:hypothetical protein